jgi:hypothetical protein
MPLKTQFDGFYFATGVNPRTYDPVRPMWGAQRWVRSGTNVCGAATYTNGQRYIACFAISDVALAAQQNSEPRTHGRPLKGGHASMSAGTLAGGGRVAGARTREGPAANRNGGQR